MHSRAGSPNSGLVRSALLDVMNEGLRGIEMHPLLVEASSPSRLARFERHALGFALGFQRDLEQRIARNLDRQRPDLAHFARLHLRCHQPFVRVLERRVTERGAASPRTGLGPRTKQCLHRAERALDDGDGRASHVLLVQGLECLIQLLCRRGSDMAQACGEGSDNGFEARHFAHEEMLFTGLDVLDGVPEEDAVPILAELEMLFADGVGLLDEWRDTEPPSPTRGRPRRRPSQWSTSDLPDGAA